MTEQRTQKQQIWPLNTKENKQRALKALTAVMGSEGKEVIIRKRVENKTTEQRGWFHVLCQLFGSETGYTQGEIKELIKRDVLGTTLVEFAGIGKFEVVKESEGEDRPGYAELIEGAYRLAAEAGIVLPNPIKKPQ